MNKTLIIGDIHLTEESIPEIKEIISEIFSNIRDIDKIIQLGDFYDNNRPTPKELEYGTQLARYLKWMASDTTIISGTGRHDILNNVSVISYLSSLGINAVKGDYIFNNVLYGHYMLYESKLQYGTGKCGIKDLKKYKYVFLGHQHNPQKLSDTIYHPGSIRYCNWGEVEDKNKQVPLLEDNKLTFIPLTSPIKMQDVHCIKELENLPKRNKVRLVIKSFDCFKKVINQLPKYENKFFEFALKTDFKIEQKEIKIETTTGKNFKQSLDTYLNENKIDKDIQNILKEITC